MQQLNMRHVLSVGMDGPNMNFKFLDVLQQEHGEQYRDVQLVVVGSKLWPAHPPQFSPGRFFSVAT